MDGLNYCLLTPDTLAREHAFRKGLALGKEPFQFLEEGYEIYGDLEKFKKSDLRLSLDEFSNKVIIPNI